MAKSILHFQEILVVAQDPRAGNLLRSGVGSQQIEAVADLLGLDHLGPAAPLQLTVWVHGIVKVFMGFEPLQRASHLASQFLRVHLFALDRRQPLEFVLCFAQSRLPKRRRKVLNSPCSVVVSPRLPRKTSKCSGRPWASVATASRTCGRSERWSRLCPYGLIFDGPFPSKYTLVRS